MQTRQGLLRSGLVLSILGAAGLMTSLPALAAGDAAKPSTTMTAPAKSDDNAAEFMKLDRNNDGYVDKTESILEPKLLAKWGDADVNKDGKISKDEFLAFEAKEHAKK